MLMLKACPHCHGDLALDEDKQCGYLYCLQCGHILSRNEERALGVRVGRNGVDHLVPVSPTREALGPDDCVPTTLDYR